MEGQLVQATWGLVVATSLLFLASVIPVAVQLIEWSNRKSMQLADIIPVLHGIRTSLSRVSAFLIDPDPSATEDDVDDIFRDVKRVYESTRKVADRKNLSLDRRLEASVLSMHATILYLHFGSLGSTDDSLESTISKEERVYQATICVRAALLALDRMERLFINNRKQLRGHTFTEEINARRSRDTDNAGKELSIISCQMDGHGET